MKPWETELAEALELAAEARQDILLRPECPTRPLGPDPQDEDSYDTPCKRCGDIATAHVVPGYPVGISCPSCDG